jgi:hypothetical protein
MARAAGWPDHGPYALLTSAHCALQQGAPDLSADGYVDMNGRMKNAALRHFVKNHNAPQQV